MSIIEVNFNSVDLPRDKKRGNIMSCKDCIHYEVCQDHYIPSVLDYINGSCINFENKSEWVHLPCKVGDMVYYPWGYDDNKGIAFTEIENIRISANGTPIVFVKDLESDMPIPTAFYPENFGETVFLTREEAERKLKERESNE